MYPDRRHPHQHTVLALAAFLLLSAAGAARCQTSADLTVVSEYAARGVSLHRGPIAQLRVEHDLDGGWYGGAFASPVTLESPTQGGRSQGQLTVYGGRALRLTPTLSWDAGVTRNTYSRDGAWSFHEFYAGLALQRASARLFYSPSYYGEGRSLYLDLSGAYPLGDQVRLAIHAGLLHPMGGYDEAARDGGDVRVALVSDVGDFTLQAGWQARWRTYLTEFPRPRAFTASASLHF